MKGNRNVRFEAIDAATRLARRTALADDRHIAVAHRLDLDEDLDLDCRRYFALHRALGRIALVAPSPRQMVVDQKISNTRTLVVRVRRSVPVGVTPLLTDGPSSLLVRGVNGGITPARATPLASPGARS